MDSPELSLSGDALLEHAAWMRQLARELVRDPGAADDLAQETWVAFLRARPDTERPLRPWLGRVMRNAASLRARRAAGRTAREVATARGERVPSAHELIERAEEQQRLARAVLALEDPYRSTLLLRYYEGLTPAEIARVRELPAATVRTHLHRGLERLRQRLDEEHDGDRRAWIAMLQPLLEPAAPALGPLALGGLVVAVVAVVTLVVFGVLDARRGATPALDGPVVDSNKAQTEVVSPAEGGSADVAARGLASSASERVLRLVDSSGRSLRGYALHTDEGSFSSDARGRLMLPGKVKTVAPVDDERLAVDERDGHGRRRNRALARAPIALDQRGQVEDEVLRVPAGPEYRLEVIAPARVDPTRLQARLVVGDGSRDAHPLAPVRPPGVGFQEHWVRFGQVPAGSSWRIELRDEAGMWSGSALAPDAPAEPHPLVRVELQQTGVLEGRVDGLALEGVGQIYLALHTADELGRVVAWTTAGELGDYSLPFVAPGEYELRVRSGLSEPWSGAASVQGGVRSVIDVSLNPAPPAGPVAGVITSASNRYRGQLLVFLLDERERVLDVFPTTWNRNDEGRLIAPFRFDAAPGGALRLDVVSLEDSVGFEVELERFEAPNEHLRVTLADERPASDWSVQAIDDSTGLRISSFELEVRIDGGAPRSYLGDALDTTEPSRLWTLHAGNLRWNQFEGPAPLRRLSDDVQLEFALYAEGFTTVRGTERDFDVLEPGRRAAIVRMRPE